MKRWWANPRIPISTTNRLRAAWVIVALTIVLWPASLLVLDEPPAILSLSWLALTITALDVLATSDVSAEVK
jgi:hypothetical protein